MITLATSSGGDQQRRGGARRTSSTSRSVASVGITRAASAVTRGLQPSGRPPVGGLAESVAQTMSEASKRLDVERREAARRPAATTMMSLAEVSQTDRARRSAICSAAWRAARSASSGSAQVGPRRAAAAPSGCRIASSSPGWRSCRGPRLDVEHVGQVVVVVRVHLLDPRRELDGLQVDVDADVGELTTRRSRASRVGVEVRHDERQLEPVAVAGLLELGPRRVGVEGVEVSEVLVPRVERRDGRADDGAVAVDEVEDALLVDRLRDRLAHAAGSDSASSALLKPSVNSPFVGVDVHHPVGVVLELAGRARGRRR